MDKVSRKFEQRVAGVGAICQCFNVTCSGCLEYSLVWQATVILNANVAFLAIPGVSPGGTSTPSQICSYISVTASVGAVATGLLLMRQNRTKHRETADDAVRRFTGSISFERERLTCLRSRLPL
jgi:hypothetical protein